MKKYVSFIVVILTLAMLVATSGCTSNQLTLSAQDYNQQGLSLANQGKYEDAIAAYTSAIYLNSQDAQFYVNRGTAYLNMKQYDLAIADFDKAIELDPNLAEAYAGRGCAYMNKGGAYRIFAIMNFNKVIELSKNADLTAYARQMLENLTQNPPLGGVIPLPPVIDYPPAPIMDNGTQQGNVNTTSAILGPWQGTFEVTNILTADTPYGESWQCESKGEFSFNMVKTGEYFIEPQGSGTIKGYFEGNFGGQTLDISDTANIEATFQVTGYKRNNMGRDLNDTYLYFDNASPRFVPITRSVRRRDGTIEIFQYGEIGVLPNFLNLTLESLEFKDGATITKDFFSRENNIEHTRVVVTIRKID